MHGGVHLIRVYHLEPMALLAGLGSNDWDPSRRGTVSPRDFGLARLTANYLDAGVCRGGQGSAHSGVSSVSHLCWGVSNMVKLGNCGPNRTFTSVDIFE